MITSKKIDVYRRRARMILQVAAGPGGWVSAIWSYCPKIGRFELNVSLHSHGLTSLGSTSISVEEVAMEVCGSELKLLVQSPRAMHWHPSGERIVVIEAGKIFIFSVTWVRKVRRNNDEIQVNRISMKRASEITCDHLEEEDAAEREEIGAVAGAEVIGVKISLWQSSINISATAMAVSSSAFLDLGGHHQNATSSLPTSTHATGGSSTNSKGYMGAMHCGRILVGTDSGAVLSLSWGWEDEPSPHTPLYISRDPPQKHNQQQHQHQQQLMDYSEHTTSTLSVSNHDPLRQQAHQHQKQQQQFEGSNDEEEEGLRRAHSVTAASRLLAAVVQPALSSADEHRDILRLWKAGKYALQHQKQPQQQHGGGGGGAPDALPEVIDIGNINEVHYGDSPLPANANNTGSSRLVDVDLTAEAADSAFSANSLSSHQNQYMTSVCAASAVRELHFSDRSRVMVCLYGDGSFTTALLQPCVVTLPASSLSEVPHQVPVKTQPSSTAVVAQQTLAPGQVHTFQVLRSAKVHPVALVAYPLPPSSTATGSGTSSGAPQNRSTGAPQLASAAGAATVAPSPTPQLFEMGSAGVYRSVDYVSSHDIESVLDLTPSLLHKVTRMRKLVTCKAEEEISRVLCMKIVDDGETHTAVLQQGSYGTNTAAVGAAGTPTVSGSFKILAIMQTKHLPTFAPAGGILAGFVGSAGGGGDTPSATDISSVHDSLIGRRLESTSLAVFEVTLLHHHHHSSHHSLSAAGASTAHPHDGASVTGGATVGVTAGMHGYEMHCVCTQAVALTTSRTQLSGSPRPGSSRGGGNSSGWSGSEGAAAAVAQPSMEIIYLSQQAGGAHVLVVEGNGSVVCRPLDNLRAVLFSINTLSASAAAAASAMSPTSLHLSQHLHLVTATAAAGRLILTVWDSQEVSAAAALAPPLTTADAPEVSKSTHDLLKLSLFHPTSDCGGGGNALRNPGSKVVVLPLLIAPAAKALPGQSSGMFVDMNEGMLHYVDAEASQHTSASASLSQSREPPTQSRSVFSVEEGLQEYHTALSAPQLKLPKRLLSDVMHYQLLCAVGNPFQPRRGYRFIQEGMLIASSKQCRVEPFNPAVSVSSKRRTFRHDFGRSSLTAMSEVLNHSSNRLSAGAGASAGPGACDATAAEYLAFVAGGSTVPYKQAQQTSSAASKQAKGASTQAAEPPRRQSPMLWVYNRNTHRWRSTYLIVGNKESRACLLKDIPTAQSVRTAEYAALSVLDARVVVEGLKDHQQKAGGSSSSGRGASSLGTQSLDDRQQGQRSSERSKSDEPVGSPPRSGLLAARVATAAGAAGASVATTAAVKSAAVVKNPTMVNNFSAEYTFAEALAPRRPSSGDSTAKPATVAPAGTDELKGSNSNNSMRRHSANDVMGPSPVSSPGRSTAFKKGVSAGAKTASNAANLDGAAVNSKPAAAGFSMQSLFSGPRWGSMASSGGGSGNPLVGPSADLLSPLPTYHRSTSVLITARSHMSCGTNAVLSVAWYSTHSIVLLTLRRSTYCIELLSREASKMSLNAGKPQPAVHKIIMLPPGYSPSSMEVLVVPCKQPPRGGAGGGAGCPPVRSRSQLFARQTGNGTIAEGDESASDAESALSDSSSDGDEEGEGDDHHHFFGDGTRFGLRRDSNSLNGALDSPSKASHTGLKSGSQDGSTGAGGGGSGGSSSPGLDGCVVVVSDGSTLLSYHVQVEGELKADLRSAIAPVGKASVPASAPPNSANSRCTLAYPPNLVVVDYAVAALWDTTLSALAVKEDFCRTYEQQNPDTPGISFPLKETKVFIQNSPLQGKELHFET